ncbi:MAG: hypothetical protein AUJ98_09045 [Bacteroidetes bacterium CG2_30_33_31]|nr:MAG: hypothetical protein AUJ98_09045 [Bacteroidetes bacterium CG2_30_33_31]
MQNKVNNIDFYIYDEFHYSNSDLAFQKLQFLPLRHTSTSSAGVAMGSAFGEDYIYQRNSYWAMPYTFSGKEKDDEIKLLGADSRTPLKNKHESEQTVYSFPIAIGIGARYYSSEGSIWLSVDPLADKGPWISPYAYCFNNPVKMLDTDGK